MKMSRRDDLLSRQQRIQFFNILTVIREARYLVLASEFPLAF